MKHKSNNKFQLNILEVLEGVKTKEKPYFNGLGEPLPWEEDVSYDSTKN